MNISDDLLCLYTATAERDGEEIVLTIPDREVSLGSIDAGTTVRVALLDGRDHTEIEDRSRDDRSRDSRSVHEPVDEPPVEAGEVRRVEIESIGDQGDGIAKVDRGYVLVVPNGEPGDLLTVRIETVTPTVGFAEIVAGQE
ncbi:TRAM domain-containing protein [Halalkalirubrum salinum]|uniref:TRAM domain-containing protein n=1 Tax=Halalkalirubrum salinum TaxID=2563889 RepID=UPI001484EBF8|nr:TRAM domain-containing protein [Halalkalirubrum salinum]